MTVVVGGHFRLRPADVEALRPAMEAVLTATRAEDGCIVYSYAEDVAEVQRREDARQEPGDGETDALTHRRLPR